MMAPGQSPVEVRAIVLAARREPKVTREWIAQYQAGNGIAGEILVRAHMPMITQIARRYCQYGARDWLDCLQEGRLGLLTGAARHDLGEAILPYLWLWTRASIQRWLSTRGQVVRAPAGLFSRKRGKPAVTSHWRPHTRLFSEMSEHFDDDVVRSFEDALVDDGPLADQQLTELDRKRASRRVATWLLEHTTPREAEIVFERFRSKPKTLQQLGDAFRVSRERIRQIEAQLFQRFRHLLPAPTRAESFDAWLERAVQFVIARIESDGRRAA